MSRSPDTDAEVPSEEAASDLARLKSEAEIEKLRLEAEELRERIEKGKKWYTGRYLAEALVGGVVAGALFVSWFVGFYSPRIAIEKERLEFAKEREKEQYDRELERQRYEKEGFLKQHVSFSEHISDGNKRLKIYLEEMKSRLQSHAKQYHEDPSEFETNARGFFAYLEKESAKLDEITDNLGKDVSRGNDLARQFRDAIDKLDNANFFLTIVYDSGFETLAYQARDALAKAEYPAKVEKWIWFREDHDPPMSSFFDDGPVLWYDREDERTSDEIESMMRALNKVFPENMTVRRGETVVVPGITWSPPQPMDVQLWLFRKG